jgi:tetratricopeptide (TPR) repeat protein
MNSRLAAADAALRAGRGAEAIIEIEAALAEDPAQSAQVYRVLLRQLYQAGRHAEGAAWGARAVERYPRNAELHNLYGVLLRRQKRYDEALAVLEAALKLNPRDEAAQVNRGNVLLDMKAGAKAEAAWTRLVREQPRNPEHQRQLGRSLVMQGKAEAALVRLRQAVSLKKDFIDAWLDYTSVFNDLYRTAEAEEVIDRALEANPGHPRLLEA